MPYTRVTRQTPGGLVESSYALRGQRVGGDAALVGLIQAYDPVVWATNRLPLHEVVHALAEYYRDDQP